MVILDSANLNKMLEARARELAKERIQNDNESKAAQRERLLKCLGLHPLPARTGLNLQTLEKIQQEGYTIEKLRYRSRPGLDVTANLYLPEASKPPVVVCSHGPNANKKAAPWVQARGIGLALQGFAAIIVDSPGIWPGDEGATDRAEFGDATDPFLCMGSPAIGHYVWDLIRALDAAEAKALDTSKSAICGESFGGEAALLAYALEDRFNAAAISCAGGSLEHAPIPGTVPGAADLRDIAGILALRAPTPLLLLGGHSDALNPRNAILATADKLKSLYGKTGALRIESFQGGWDYNRRMRESTYAFFQQHLLGKQARDYVAELRPLTDGRLNAAECNTLEPERLRTSASDVSDPEASQQSQPGNTFQKLLREALEEPYPEPYNPADRLVAWGRYGRIELKALAADLALHDADTIGAPGSVSLPLNLDQNLLIHLGINAAEFYAQLLHLALPGGPDGWENKALTGDALTSMIASVKTLMGSHDKASPLDTVAASGPLASLTANYLKLLRPGLKVTTTHSLSSWQELADQGMPQLIQPCARYMKWPFAQVATIEPPSEVLPPTEEV